MTNSNYEEKKVEGLEGTYKVVLHGKDERRKGTFERKRGKEEKKTRE